MVDRDLLAARVVRVEAGYRILHAQASLLLEDEDAGGRELLCQRSEPELRLRRDQGARLAVGGTVSLREEDLAVASDEDGAADQIVAGERAEIGVDLVLEARRGGKRGGCGTSSEQQ